MANGNPLELNLVPKLDAGEVKKSAEKLGKQVDKALNSSSGKANEKKLKLIGDASDKVEKKLEGVRKRMSELELNRNVSKEFKNAQKDVSKLGDALDKATEKASRMTEKFEMTSGKKYAAAIAEQEKAIENNAHSLEVWKKRVDEVEGKRSGAKEMYGRMLENVKQREEELKIREEALKARVDALKARNAPTKDYIGTGAERKAIEEEKRELQKQKRNIRAEETKELEQLDGRYKSVYGNMVKHQNAIASAQEKIKELQGERQKNLYLSGVTRAQDEVDKLQDQLTEAEATLQSIIDAGNQFDLNEDAQNEYTALQNSADELLNTMRLLGEAADGNSDIKSALENIQDPVDRLKLKFYDLKQSVQDALTSNTINPKEMVKNFAGTGVQAAKDFTQNLKNNLDFAPVQEKVNGVVDKIKETFSSPANLKQAGENMIHSVHDGIMSGFNRLGSGISEKMNGVGAKIIELNHKILDAFKMENIESAVSGAMARAKQAAVEGASTIVAAVGAEISELPHQIASIFSGVANGVKGFFGGLLQQSEEIQKLGNYAKQATSKILSLTKSLLQLVGGTIRNGIAKITESLRGAEKASSSAGLSFGRLVRYALGFTGLAAIFRKLRSAIRDGMDILSTFNGKTYNTANAINNLKSSMANLRVSWAVAFTPIISVVLPILQRLINILISAANAVGAFFAVLTGKGTMVRATATGGGGGGGAAKPLEDVADAADDAGDAMNDAEKDAKKLKGQLAGFDDLDVLNPPENEDDALDDAVDKAKKLKDALDKAGGGGGGGGYLFEEVAVEHGWIDDLLRPILEAWDRAGDYFVKSWQRAFDNIKKLLKDIGKDFLTMWNQEETIRMLEDIIYILGDIGAIIANIADQLDYAWRYNQNGLHLWEVIRDICATIIGHIRDMADETVVWSRNLDFRPLLESIIGWLQSVRSMADGVWGILKDFYVQVLLPMSKFTLEKGLPELFNIMKRLNDSIDWAKIRTAFRELFTELEKLGRLTWNGLMTFIDKCLAPIGRWVMNQAIPQLTKALTDLAKRIDWNKLNQGFERLWKAISKFARGVGQGLINFVTAIIESEAVIGIIENLANGLAYLVEHLNELVPILGTVIGLMAGISIANWILGIVSAVSSLMAVLPGLVAVLMGPAGIVIALTTIVGIIAGIKIKHHFDEATAAVEDFGVAARENLRAREIEEFGYAISDMNTELGYAVESYGRFIEASRERVEGSGLQEAALAETLLSRYSELSGQVDLTAAEQLELQHISERLCEIYPELNQYLNEETGLLEAQPELIQQIIDKKMKEIEIRAIEEEMVETKKQLISAERELAQATEDLANAQKSYSDACADLQPIKDQVQEYQNIKSELESLPRYIDDLTGKTEFYGDGQARFNEILARTGIEASNYDEAIGQIGTTLDTLTEQLKTKEAEVDEAFQNMVDASKFKEGMEMAMTDLSGYYDTLGTEMSDRFKGLAGDAGDGFVGGIEEKTPEMETASQTAAEDTGDAFADGQESNSPSRLYERMAGDAVDGFVQGIEQNQDSAATAAATMAELAVSAFQSAFEPLVEIARSIVNAAIDVINQGMASIAAGVGGMSVSGGNVNGGSMSLPSVNYSNIPHLAQGAVIPPNKEFLAMLGDQKQGTNIETPLDTMVDAFRSALGEYFSVGVGQQATMEMDGVVVARTLMPHIIDEMRRKGYNVKVLGA